MKNLAKVADVDVYTIHLVNQSADTQNFWCFLQEPVIQSGSQVFGNSDTCLSVASYYSGNASFGIPIQYNVGAGAANNAVGLGIIINTNYIVNANIGDSFDVDYATAPPNQGPTVTSSSSGTDAGSIEMTTNTYNKIQNANNNWYENMSFGLETDSGYIGVTWDPSPNTSTIITPKFSFYITTGNFVSNDLVDLTTVGAESAQIELSDFEQGFDVTVTLNADGSWNVTTGKP